MCVLCVCVCVRVCVGTHFHNAVCAGSYASKTQGGGRVKSSALYLQVEKVVHAKCVAQWTLPVDAHPLESIEQKDLVGLNAYILELALFQNGRLMECEMVVRHFRPGISSDIRSQA